MTRSSFRPHSTLAPARAAHARRLRLAVSLTFPVAFAIHDAEELLVARRWHRRAPTLLRRRFPNLPAPVIKAISVGPGRMKWAVGLMACAVAGVTSTSLARLDRPLPSLRAVVAVFGGHVVTHAAQSLVLRGYTPGVVSAAVLVAPYSRWAWRALEKADISADQVAFGRSLLAGAPAVLVVALLGHLLGAVIDQRAGSPKALAIS